MSTDLLRIEANERIDQQDFEFLSDTQQQAALRVPANFWTDPTQQRLWILDGFAITNPAGKQVQVTRGRALLGMREEGQVYYGMLTVAGDATKIVDITSFGAGTYSVYIRFEYVDAETQSRVFWNPAGNGTEFAQSIATRRQANWSLRVEAASPGGEWFKIGEVDQATMAITDQRDFYYEGKVSDTYANVWGAGNDRNADRQQYGVTNLQQFTAAMRTALEDVKGQGLRRWWDDSIGGMNVGFSGSPTEDRVAIGDANNYIELTGGTTPSWIGDTADVLRYSRGSDYWEMLVNNAQRLRVEETQTYLASNVGIGIDPTAALTVSSGTADAVARFASTDATAFIGLADSGSAGADANRWQVVSDEHQWFAADVQVLALDTTNLRPVGDRDLGAAGSRWRDIYATNLYASTLVDVTGASPDVVIDATSGFAILKFEKSNVEKWAFYQDTNDMQVRYGGNTKFTWDGDGSAGHFYPAANTQDLGISGSRWGTLYGTDAVLGGQSYSSVIRLNVLKNVVDAGGFEIACAAELDLATTQAGTKAVYTATVDDNRASGTQTELQGFNVFLSKDNDGDIGNYYAFRSNYSVSAPTAAAITNLAAYWVPGGTLGANTTVANLSGLHINQPTVTGTVTTQYGLRLGFFGNAATNYGLYISGTSEGSSDYGIYVNDAETFLKLTRGTVGASVCLELNHFVANPGSADGHQTLLSRLRSDFTGAQTGTITNLFAQSQHSTTQTVDDWVGVRSDLIDSGTATGTIGSFRAFQSGAAGDGFTITEYIGFRATNAGGTGAVTNQYGILIEDQTFGATLNYGLYIAGAGTHAIHVAGGASYFGGNVGFGETSPDTKVHIYGGASGVSAPAAGTLLTLEDDAAHYISFLSPAAQTAGIRWGDPTNGTADGYMNYNHSVRTLLIGAAGATRVQIDSSAIRRGTSAMDIGTSGFPFNSAHCEYFRAYNTSQTPGSQADLLIRNQQNNVVARAAIDVSTPTSPSILGDHWNVASVSRVQEGQFRINFDEDVDDDCSVAVALRLTASSVLYTWWAVIASDGTHVDVYVYRIGQGSQTGAIDTGGGAAYITRDDADVNTITIAIIGRGETLQ